MGTNWQSCRCGDISGAKEAHTGNPCSVCGYDSSTVYLKVSYNGNGNTSGTEPLDGTSYKSGDEVTVLGNTNLTRTDHAFNGWNTVANGSGTAYTAGAKFTITADTTLFAQWIFSADIPELSAAGWFEEIDGGAAYRVKRNGSIAPPARFRIPATYNGKPVTEIGKSGESLANGVFAGRTNIVTVALPDSITCIGDHAFNGCSDLTNVILPNSVTIIRQSAFKDCSSLGSVTDIDQSTFQGCTGMISVTIGNSVSIIGGNAFQGCTSLGSITIPNNVTSLGNDAFRGCTSLTSVTIKFNIIYELHPNCFNGLGNLRSEYRSSGIGTYTRLEGESTWTKVMNN